MNIVLHCGGMPFDGTTIEHHSLGGSETSAYYLAKHLARLGHRVTLFTTCQLDQEGEYDSVYYAAQGNATEQSPLGDRFHPYAQNTPHDVLIVQRRPDAFTHQWASKVNILWLHDLALYQNKPAVYKAMYNVSRVWCVSNWHKQQLIDVWGLHQDIIDVVRNGVDLSLFEDKPRGEWGMPQERDKHKLLYTSRPERGLEHLVAPNGIMERLGDDYVLYVCNYANVTGPMVKYYAYLEERCKKLSNVIYLEHLNKAELSALMIECDLLTYPTQFEEVSCITAMEAMAAGLPMLTCPVAALPETCANSGTRFVQLKDNGDMDVEAFTKRVQSLIDSPSLEVMSEEQKLAAMPYNWSTVVFGYLNSIEDCFRRKSELSIVNHFIEHSDIYALQNYITEDSSQQAIDTAQSVIDKYYGFTKSYEAMEEHYESYYADTELNRASMENMPRFGYVSSLLDAGDLPNGSDNDCSVVLDYGCGHGHFTVNLAKAHPSIEFIGIDVSQKNIKFARAWAEDEGLNNIEFYWADIMQNTASEFWDGLPALDYVICAEVLEHVPDPQQMMVSLTELLKASGKFIATTPYGRWEHQSFGEYGDYRFHLHHFEREDIVDMAGTQNSLDIMNIPTGNDPDGFLLGSYVWSFTTGALGSRNTFGDIDYERKFNLTMPRQTLGLAMIVKDCEDTLARAVHSVLPYVNELVICTDNTSTVQTTRIAQELCLQAEAQGVLTHNKLIRSPLETGFDVARNESIAEINTDWILWLDSDEEFNVSDMFLRLLRNNQYNGYAVQQHHFSISPPGVMKTDLPLRLFRNNVGMQFFGRVHEHPSIELNDGGGHAQLIHTASIAHYGYDTDVTRKGRFERNVDLMARDREDYPDRKLGMMLWLRDLCQMNQYEVEVYGPRISQDMQVRAHEGIRMWRDLLDMSEARLVIESLDWYNSLSELLGYSFEMSIALTMSKCKGQVDPAKAKSITGLFQTREDAENLIALLMEEGYDHFDSKYYA